jgi:anti-sigma regulatory factor (Ser/Thr protein kinase)
MFKIDLKTGATETYPSSNVKQISSSKQVLALLAKSYIELYNGKEEHYQMLANLTDIFPGSEMFKPEEIRRYWAMNSEHKERLIFAKFCNNETNLLVCSSNRTVVATRDSAYELQYNGELLVVSDIYESHPDTLYFATGRNGILVYENGKLRSAIEQLPEMKKMQFWRVIGQDGYLYALCKKGLYKIDIDSQEAWFIDRLDGMPSSDINDILVHDGHIWIAAAGGLVDYPLSAQSANPVSPKVVLTKFLLNEADTSDWRHEFTYDENTFQFHLSGRAFKSRKHFHFKYRLKNLNNEWTELSSGNNNVRFTTVPPGDYVFELVAVNEDGVVSEAGVRYEIRISKPFWNEWWFYVLAVLGISGILFLIYKIRVRAIRNRGELKQEIVASRLTAIRAQMNPHFMFNALNSIQDLVLAEQVEETNEYLGTFSDLMRMILENSSKETISIYRQLEVLELYLELEQLRFAEDFEYKILKEGFTDVDHFEVVPMLIQPFVENAIKHGLLHKAGEKTLVIELIKDEVLTCIITDNGIGREKAMEIKKRRQKYHGSFSTAANKNRIELLSDLGENKFSQEIIDLKHEDGSSAGTQVRLILPIFEEEYT